MYAGLTTADKGALLDAKKYGKWIAKDASGTLYAYRNKPVKKSLIGGWYDMTWVALKWIYISFIHWDDDEPVNIDTALAQIAEMEKAQKPSGCGWCNGVTRMSGTFWTDKDENCGGTFDFEFCPNCGRSINSPYTEGETKNG